MKIVKANSNNPRFDYQLRFHIKSPNKYLVVDDLNLIVVFLYGNTIFYYKKNQSAYTKEHFYIILIKD